MNARKEISLEPHVLRPGLLQGRDAGIGIFPEALETERLPITSNRKVLPEINDSGPSPSTSWQTQARNRSAPRAFAFAASSSLLFGGALVSRERRSRVETPATSSIAARNAASLAFDGLLKPLIFLTYCSDAARISSSVTGGSKLKSIFMFRHIFWHLAVWPVTRLRSTDSF
jgi:hypothetical protein